jgi:hypothetical protein
MKKEDMSRLYGEEKAVLKHAANNNYWLTGLKIIIIVLIPFSGLFPQIPINGFCKYTKFEVDSGFTDIFTTNFNGDSYTDIVLFNPHKKEVLALEGNQNGTFKKAKPYRASLELSGLQSITNKNNQVTGFAYSSRKSMKAGFLDFSKDGKVRITKEYKFKSYPDVIETADINGDGKNEILAAGSAFDGISILEERNNSLHENKVAVMKSFTNAVFTDLSNDGYPDIAAFNVLDNTIDFYYNSSTGNFSKVRSTGTQGRVAVLKSFDMNLDYYQDLIYSCGSSITILYGDPTSSYRNKKVIKTNYSPDKIVTGDFNNDGHIDIVYLDVKQSIISVIFARDAYSFYPEILYMQNEGLKNILPYYSKFINGILAVNNKGSVYTITKLLSFSGEVNLGPVIRPSVISDFDYDNNGITDICCIDNFDSRIKFIVRNNAGIPYLYYSYPVYSQHTNILIDESKPGEKTFYCYSYGKRLIEAINADLNQNKFSRQTFYSPGEIEDLKIGTADGNVKIYPAYKRNGKLGFSVITYHNFRYTASDYFDIADNASGISISLRKEPSVYYWQTNSKTVKLLRYSIEKKYSEKIVEASLPSEIKTLTSFTGDLMNNKHDITIAFCKGNNDGYIVLASAEMTKIVNAKNLGQNFDFPSKKDLYFKDTRFSGSRKMIIMDNRNSSAFKLDFMNRGKNISFTKIADINYTDSYFVNSMSYKKTHIAFSNRLENCITIKEF